MKHINIIYLLKIRQSTQNQNMRLNTYLNPYSYLRMRKNLDLLSRFDNIEIDGIALVVILKFFGIINVPRKSFDMSSYAPLLFNKASESKKSIYFIGATDQDIQIAVKNIISAFPQLNIIGKRHGFFKDQNERTHILQKLHAINPDILVCGMSTPLQEQFLLDLQNLGWNGTGYTCGGFLHQSAHKLYYYPKFIDTYHLRWLYRIYKEPKLIQRYIWEYPKFLIYFMIDFIQWKYSKSPTE